jgi:8-oxo-dGTP diphosphatase
VFPGGCVEPGETAVQAAVRECVEETGVVVVAGREIGRRVHPVTGRTVVYVVCGPADADAGHSEPVVAAPDELVEVLWLSPAEVEPRMPDLFAPVRAHLGLGQRR